MKVLVNGIGNIGTTLTNLLLAFREILAIDEIYLNKNIPRPWLEHDLSIPEKAGAIICTSADYDKYIPLPEVIHDINYIFECTSTGIGLRNLDLYKALPDLLGACAQGSETGCGTPFMTGINAEVIKGEKFVNVVSCNTHAIASILQAFSIGDPGRLHGADIVIARRSEDIGNHRRLVGASVVSRHLDPSAGTHHAIDVRDLYRTVGIEINLTTSVVTTPSQMMHVGRFCIDLNYDCTESLINDLLDKSHFVSVTDKFDSNAVFELGRRYGFQGRIYSHAIVVVNNLLVSGSNVKGWMFVPQEGNTLLSTLDAFLLQTRNENRESAFEAIRNELLSPTW